MEMVKDYNTGRSLLILREYGRNILKLIDFIKTFDDKKKRTEYAQTLINLMRQIVPGANFNRDNEQKFWDDLHIISHMELDINAPYPKPEEKILYKKPDRIKYHKNNVKLKHYGRNIELLIEKATETKDPDERENAIIYIGKLMKTFQATWNKGNAGDAVIVKNINELSGGALNIDVDRVIENNLFEVLYKDKGRSRNKPRRGPSRGQGSGKSSSRNQYSGRNQNRRRRS